MQKLVSILLLVPLVGIACGTRTVSRSVQVTTMPVETVTVTKQVTPPPRVFVPQDSLLIYKPDSIGLGASSEIDHIRWTTYGYATAVGVGAFPRNDCDPSCAGGHITPVKVVVRLTRRILCRGVLAYDLWSIEGAGFDHQFDVISPEANC